jgi:hypothetical protein
LLAALQFNKKIELDGKPFGGRHANCLGTALEERVQAEHAVTPGMQAVYRAIGGRYIDLDDELHPSRKLIARVQSRSPPQARAADAAHRHPPYARDRPNSVRSFIARQITVIPVGDRTAAGNIAVIGWRAGCWIVRRGKTHATYNDDFRPRLRHLMNRGNVILRCQYPVRPDGKRPEATSHRNAPIESQALWKAE